MTTGSTEKAAPLTAVEDIYAAPCLCGAAIAVTHRYSVGLIVPFLSRERITRAYTTIPTTAAKVIAAIACHPKLPFAAAPTRAIKPEANGVPSFIQRPNLRPSMLLHSLKTFANEVPIPNTPRATAKKVSIMAGVCRKAHATPEPDRFAARGTPARATHVGASPATTVTHSADTYGQTVIVGIAPELVGAGTRLRLPLIDSGIAVHELNASIAQAGRNVLHAHELISCRSLGRQGVRRPYVFHGAGRLIVDFFPADFPVVGHGGNCSIQTCAPYRSRRLRELLACHRHPRRLLGRRL